MIDNFFDEKLFGVFMPFDIFFASGFSFAGQYKARPGFFKFFEYYVMIIYYSGKSDSGIYSDECACKFVVI